MDRHQRRLERYGGDLGAQLRARVRRGEAAAAAWRALVNGGTSYADACACAEALPDFEAVGWGQYPWPVEAPAILSLRHPVSGLEFVVVPGGRLRLVRDGSDGAGPEVCVAPFVLARTSCTQRAWDRLAGEGVEDARSFWGPELPIEGVSWEDARAWCARAGLSLPSEAEWEHACRAGSDLRFAATDEAEALPGWSWFVVNAQEGPQPVAQLRPNGFGLFDMVGNVWDWCEDDYRTQLDGIAPDGSPWTKSPRSEHRLQRGGGWRNSAELCRVGVRSYGRSADRVDLIGFRPSWP